MRLICLNDVFSFFCFCFEGGVENTSRKIDSEKKSINQSINDLERETENPLGKISRHRKCSDVALRKDIATVSSRNVGDADCICMVPTMKLD